MAELKIGASVIRTIIFDFDGTLAKLNIDFQSMRETVMNLISCRGVSREAMSSHFILEMIDAAFETIRRRSEQEAGEFFTEANAVIEKIETDAAERGELFGSTRKLLMSLRAANLACGIITRNCAKAVKIVFPDILDYCPVLICRDDVGKVKPHPEHIGLAMSRLDSSPHHTLMIGDHPIDIVTGRNARTLTCGVLTGRCGKNDFIDAGADLVLNNAADILSILETGDGN